MSSDIVANCQWFLDTDHKMALRRGIGSGKEGRALIFKYRKLKAEQWRLQGVKN